MHSIQLYIIAIALFTCIACIMPGIFLLLRGIALMSDAISHAILPGIVIMFLLVGNLSSPLLIVGAAIVGLATVMVTELLIQTQRMGKDTAIGLVFPCFFSIGVILINQYARNAHLDLDMVLLGELAFAPFNRLYVNAIDCGPQVLWIMASVAIINSVLVLLFYKELVLATFDATLAHILGLRPTAMYYGLMTVTSITAVTAFNVVGSTIIVALMLIPAATAYLITNRVIPMIILSCIIGFTTVITGYTLASIGDLSIAGSMATMAGIFFIIAWICAPEKGLLAHIFFERSYKKKLAVTIVRTFLQQGPASCSTIAQQLGWKPSYAHTIVTQAMYDGYVSSLGTMYRLATKN